MVIENDDNPAEKKKHDLKSPCKMRKCHEKIPDKSRIYLHDDGDRWVGGWMDGRMGWDGWTDGWMGLMDGLIDGWMDNPHSLRGCKLFYVRV